MNRIPKDKTHRRFQTEQNNKPKKESEHDIDQGSISPNNREWIRNKLFGIEN
jgi:hypothetical protein